jgi:hypothetical protein
MVASAEPLPAFQLEDLEGQPRAFPSGRPALLVFVYEECDTCNLAMPVIEALQRAHGQALDLWVVGQDTVGNRKLVEEHGLTAPMLDDDALAASFAYGVETVPFVVLADGEGREEMRITGFEKDEWRALDSELAAISGASAEVAWDEYPQLRPGCGSRSVEPGIYERLVAEAEGSPLRARRLEIGDGDDIHDFLFDQGLTDGLPVVPPTTERVLRMLEGTRRNAQEVVATVPPNMAPATVEKIAINAVMAGCRPEYLPVVIAAVEAVCNDEFNAHGVLATTMGATPVLVVNGPIRHRIGMNMQLGELGQGNRANASIGRALMLVLRNIGGAKPGGTERSTHGNPMKHGVCFAEWEERSPWAPLHVERGFDAEESVVTAFAQTGLGQITDQTSRTAHQLVGSLGMSMEGRQHPKAHGAGDTLLVIPPEHVDTIWRDGWTKEQIRERIQQVTARPMRELLQDDESGAGVPLRMFGDDGPTEEQLAQLVPKFRGPEYIHIAVAGSEAGKFAAIFETWVSGPTGSIPVSRRIEDI